MLGFSKVSEHKPGTVFLLLRESFSQLWNDEMEQKMRLFDKEVFEHPDTVGTCTFISTINGKPIGMASYDPRTGPEVGTIGYSCILPEFRRRGFGRAQVEEILRRLRATGFKKAAVTTGEHPFFLPAQKMYLACGFKEVKRYDDGRDPRYSSIDYELELPENVK